MKNEKAGERGKGGGGETKEERKREKRGRSKKLGGQTERCISSGTRRSGKRGRRKERDGRKRGWQGGRR